jgi:ubiquinone biosynthesis protein
MVFRDGVYHADPHPGNFLLPDGQHLAILDFGDVGHLTGPRRSQLEALLLAAGSRDVEEVTDIVIEITHAPAELDADRLSGQIGTWLSRYLGGSVANLDLVGMVNAGMQIMHSNHLTFPSDLALLFHVFVQLQGLSSSVGAKVSLTELLQPYWEEMTRDRLNPVSVGRRALRTLRGWERLLATAPRKLRPTLRQLQDGTIGVEFRIHDADGVTDRLVDGILAAASILASAELIGRRTGPRIRCVYPRSDRAHRWCDHLATPASQSRRPPEHLQAHSPDRRPAVPTECALPKLDAVNRWTSDSPANRRRYDSTMGGCSNTRSRSQLPDPR